MIGKIERLPLRSVWQHEAYNFTQWLQDNIELLNEVIAINLSNPEREQNAGSFSVDIVAEDDNGNPVVIENQLEKSNHDHLCKFITYLVSIEARTAIWIVADPRTEHVNAINWLNESSAAEFYLIKLEAIKIEESVPAALFTVIVGPSAESKEIGRTKKEFTERDAVREKFWIQLLEYAKQKTKLHSNRTSTIHNWLGTGAGISGLTYSYVIRKDEAQVELYIDRGDGSDDVNRDIFNLLFEKKAEIEKVFGGQLEWQRLEGKRACRIRKVIKAGGYRSENWNVVHEEMVDNMVRFEKALKPHLKKVDVKTIG